MGDAVSGVRGRLRRLMSSEIWDADLRAMPRLRAILYFQLRVASISARAFVRERLQMRAMALTYITLFSIVPVLAVSFSLFKGFAGLQGIEKKVVPLVLSTVVGDSAHKAAPGTPEAIRLDERRKEIEEGLRTYIEKIQGGAIGGIGFLFLLWSVISLLSHIERAFNDIWGVKQERVLFQKVVYYLFSVIVGPLFLGLSISATAALSNQKAVQWVLDIVPHGDMLFGLAVPVVASLLAFFLLYTLMPNTVVQVRSALAGAVVAAVAFEVAKFCYFDLMVGSFRKYDAVFSSLAAVPLFILWIYFSWIIVLIGASVAFAAQNARTYRSEEEALTASQAFREILAMRIMALLSARFQRGEAPVGSQWVAETLQVPVRLVRDVVFVMGEAGLLVETAAPAAGHVPARPPGRITPRDIVRVLRDKSGINLKIRPDGFETYLEDLVQKAEGVGGEAYATVDFEQIAERIAGGARKNLVDITKKPVHS